MNSPLVIRYGVPTLFLLLWCAGFAVAKIGIAYAEPLTFLAIRFGLALAVMVVIFAIMRPPLPKSRAGWVHQIRAGVLIQALYFGMSYYAFSLGVSAGAVALIVSLQPILVAILAPSLAGEHISGRRWAGLILGLDGAAIVILARSQIEATSGLGLACVGLALLGMTAAALFEKTTPVKDTHPVSANLIQYAAGFFITLPLAMATETMQVQFTPALWGALAYLVVGNSLIAVSLLLLMIRQGEVARVSALLFLVPPGAALMAWPMIGEVMPLLAWPGLVLAAIGVLVASRKTA